MHSAQGEEYINRQFTMTINLNTPNLKEKMHKLSIYDDN